MSQPSVVVTPELDSTLRSRWRVALPSLGLALLALAFALHDPAWRLWDLWLNSFEYGHGMVVVPVTLYLLWLRRDAFRAETPAPDWRGLALTALLMGAWFLSRALGIVLGEQILLVLLLLSVTMGMAGVRIAAIAALPVLYLMFAVPVWTYVSPLMQSFTAEVSASMARALGVPIYLEGLYMTIPDGRFLVAETCSGLRYLLAAMSLGGFFALLNLHSTWARCAILLFCVALGVLFNWIRVVGIVLIGHHSHMQSSLVGDHITFGWVLFLGVVVATLGVGRMLERLEGPVPALQPPPAMGLAPARAFLVAGGVGLALILVPAITAWQVLRVDRVVPGLALPETLDDGTTWTREAFPNDAGWRPRFQGAHSDPIARYRNGSRWVDLYVAYYPIQRQDAEAVNDINRLFDSKRWRRYSQKAVPIRIDATPDLPVSEYRLVRKGSNTRRLVWWSYWVDARFTPDPVTAKWFQLLAALSGRYQAAALVLSTEISGEDQVAARERLSAFATAVKEPVLGMLEDAARVR